jgi:hypothetical protein
MTLALPTALRRRTRPTNTVTVTPVDPATLVTGAACVTNSAGQVLLHPTVISGRTVLLPAVFCDVQREYDWSFQAAIRAVQVALGVRLGSLMSVDSRRTDLGSGRRETHWYIARTGLPRDAPLSEALRSLAYEWADIFDVLEAMRWCAQLFPDADDGFYHRLVRSCR